MSKQITFDHTDSRKKPRVLAINENDSGSGFQVMGGLRFTLFHQVTGFQVDAFGWRLVVSFWPWRPKQFIRHRQFFFYCRRRGYDPPWERLKIGCGFMEIALGRAYGGYLA